MAREGDAPQAGRGLTRRTLIKTLAVAAGAAALAPASALAQTSHTDPPVAPPSVVTGRDFGPDADPNVYFTDPDVLTVEPAFNSLRQANAPIQRLWTGALWAEGPAWNSVGKFLVWSDIPNNLQKRWIEDDARVTTFSPHSGYSNGNTFDYQGRQLSCEHSGRRVARY